MCKYLLFVNRKRLFHQPITGWSFPLKMQRASFTYRRSAANFAIGMDLNSSNAQFPYAKYMLCLALVCLIAIVQPMQASAQHLVTGEEFKKIDVLCSEQQVEPMGPTRKRLDPKRLFLVDLGPYQFAVPWEYFLGRPRPYLPGCIRDNYPWLSVQYWIPDGNAPEKDHNIRYQLQPVEKTRPAPQANEWYIEATQLQYYEHSIPSRFDADGRLRRIVNRLDGELIYEDMLDMYAIKSRISSSYYYKKTDSYSLFIRCSRRVLDINWHGNRVCSAYLVLKELKLFGSLLVPVEAIKYNAVIVETLETLLERWKVEN